MVVFTGTVTNIGRVAWTDSHHVAVWDDNGRPVTFVRVAAAEPAAPRTVAFRIRLPAKAGAYRYHFQCLKVDVEYFGPVQTRTVVVDEAPASEAWTYVAGPHSATEARTATYTFTGHLPAGDLRALEVAWRTPDGEIDSVTGWMPLTSAQTEFSIARTLSFNRGLGDYTLWINLRDSEGRVRDGWKDNITAERFTVRVQPPANAAPDWTITQGPATVAPRDTRVYTFTAHDPDANLAELEVAWRTPAGTIRSLTKWFSTGGSRAIHSATVPITFSEGDGLYEVWVNARDAHGAVRDPAYLNLDRERLAIRVAAPAPPITGGTRIGETSFTAEWGASAGATRFRLQVARSPAFPPESLILDVNVGAARSLDVGGLIPGNDYYYRVIPYGDSGFAGDSATSSRIRTASPAWSWDQVVTGTGETRDLVLVVNRNRAPHFEFRLGAGGAIENVAYSPRNLDLTVPATVNRTDGVIQWLTWANGDTFKTFAPPADPQDGEQFNQNQAGGDYDARTSSVPVFSPIVKVLAPAGAGYVAVYARQQEQWRDFTRALFRAKFPCYVRYDLFPDGVLKIRRVVLVGTLYKSQGNAWLPFNTIADGLYWENYTPFDSNPLTKPDGSNPWTAGFNAYSHLPAFGFNDHGQLNPATFWLPTQPGRDYNSTPVAQTRGYTLAFNKSRHPSYGPALGVVFGKSGERHVDTQATDGIHILNYKNWHIGFAILPAIGLGRNLEAGDGAQLDARGQPIWGSVVDYTLYLAPDDHVSDAYLEKLDRLAAAGSTGPHPGSHPAPTLYGPSHNYSQDPELGEIVTRLREIARDRFEGSAVDLPDWNQSLQHPSRTNHVGSFLPR